MVANARAQLSLDGSPFRKELEAIGAQASGKFTDTMKNVGRGIVAAFSAREVVAFAQQVMASADAVDNLSTRLGFGKETVQSLGVVAKDSGLGFEKFEAAILKVNKGIVAASAGNKELTGHFEALGLSVSDLQSMNAEQVFESIAKAMAQNRGDAETLNAAFKILGDEAGPKLQTVMVQLGEQGFGNLNKQMVETGRIMSEDVVTSLDRAEQKIAVVTDVVKTKFTEWAAAAIEAVEAMASGQTIEDMRALEQATAQMAEQAKAIEAERMEAVKAYEAEQAKSLETRRNIAALEKEISDLTKVQLAPAVELNNLKLREKEIEEGLAALNVEGQQNYEQQLTLQRDLILVKNQIRDKEAEIAKISEAAMAQEAKLLDDLNAARARYYADQSDATWEQFNAAEKLVILQDRLNNLKLFQASLDINIADDALQYIQTSDDIAKTQDEINKLKGIEVEISKESAELSTDQLQRLKDMQEVFKGMTENEIADFVAGLRSLAEKLNQIPKVNGLEWLTQLSGFKLPDFTSGQAGQFARSIERFLRELAGIPPPDLKFLADLEKISNLRMPDITSGQAAQTARAIKELFEGLDGIKEIPIASLERALELVRALSAAGPGGRWELDLKLPEGMEDGVPLMMPEGFAGTLTDLAASARTIASLKGVIFA